MVFVEGFTGKIIPTFVSTKIILNFVCAIIPRFKHRAAKAAYFFLFFFHNFVAESETPHKLTT